MVIIATLWWYWPLNLYPICFCVNGQLRLLANSQEDFVRNILSALFMIAYALPCFGQTSTEYQFRPLLHWQVGHFAGWSILPDITASPFKTLQVAGWLSKDEQNWREVMVGIVADTNGLIQPVVNLRAYSKGTWSDLYAELHLLSNRTLASTFVTIPLPGQVRIGIESEFLTGLTDQVKSKTGIGPRISVKVPKTTLSIATTVFFNIKSNVVVRTYIVYNLMR